MVATENSFSLSCCQRAANRFRKAGSPCNRWNRLFVSHPFVPTRVGDDSFEVLATTVAFATFHFGWVLVAASKYRLVHALFGVFLPGLALYAGLRLAKPRSLWAKRFYGPTKKARAEQRFHAGRVTDRFKERLRDAIGGVTEEEYKARLAASASRPPV